MRIGKRNLARGGCAHALVITLLLAPVNPASAETAAERAVREASVARDLTIAEDKAKAAQAAAASQKQAQADAEKTSDEGGQMANMLGMALMAGGAVMIAVGTVPCAEGACNWPMIAAGAFTIAGGVGSMMAGQKMGDNAKKAGQNVGGLDSIGGLGVPGGTTAAGTSKPAGNSSSNSIPGSETAQNSSGGKGIKIDPDELRNGKLGEMFDKFEAATGINRDTFAQGVADGIPPAELLKGIGGLTKDELQNAIDNAAASGGAGGGPLGGHDIEKLAKDMGLEDMYAKAVGEEGVDFNGGGGASRGLASTNAAPAAASGFDFGKLGASEAVQPPANAGADMSLLSDDVKRALAKEGRTGQTLFQIVSARYRKVTPMMFGQDVDPSALGAGSKPASFVDEPLMQ